MSKSSKLSAYINRSLNRAGLRIDRKITISRHHLVDEIHAGLKICFGSAYRERIEAKLTSPDFQGSEEQKCLTRIIESIADELLRQAQIRNLSGTDPATDPVVSFVEETASLRAAMSELDPKDRALLWGKHVEEKTYRQLAEELSSPRSTLEDRLTKLNKNLLDKLIADGHDLT